ncbi:MULTISPECIES: MGDG synthase family glycosyltransferase [unclassified Undibacterium]|uniref:MGDG synthase family glycosyltransferase n=1 Tax=unclassified Undibacterium TaxID=2630295 RepID=UPI002AC8DEA2|nr:MULTISPECIES: glycosyltransferase [unclassified Undibacterium]MEB0140292.1 glycosyltransferase [Undibacterium sp. CCC2.1]MEB0173294.1 glycosyltransferase [Undibacterium sp. CCC1.1]MEB0177113.1 glycosyltransferase [Undibacterium sp. CCC3.4]MEB0216431.1 glycosyltransferase [Undibacterium sp. 5I2]WPX45515.1 glycosyltransferase [Undibacterium sp. CCC3.4]
MRKKKILLLSVSAGAGHRRAAEALQASAVVHAADSEVIHLDVMDFVSSGFRKIYTDFYIKLVSSAPNLWGYLYQASNEAKTNSALERLRRSLERLNTRTLFQAIAEFAPDAIICTHFLPAELLSRRIAKQQFHCPVFVQVTDFDLHRMWVHQHMAGYFAASEEIADRMRSAGIAPERIHVTGIPVMPHFEEKPLRQQCAAEIGIDPARLTILLMGGGAGLGGLAQIAAGLLALDTPFQLLVLAGNNAPALAALQELAQRFPTRLFPFAYSRQVERLMACADLVITKPGGLTTSECLAYSLPLLLNAPIRGQEERNADYLLECGAALKAYDDVSLLYRVRYLLQHPEKLQAMRTQAGIAGKPYAAATVLHQVLHSLPSKALP